MSPLITRLPCIPLMAPSGQVKSRLQHGLSSLLQFVRLMALAIHRLNINTEHQHDNALGRTLVLKVVGLVRNSRLEHLARHIMDGTSRNCKALVTWKEHNLWHKRIKSASMNLTSSHQSSFSLCFTVTVTLLPSDIDLGSES